VTTTIEYRSVIAQPASFHRAPGHVRGQVYSLSQRREIHERYTHDRDGPVSRRRTRRVPLTTIYERRNDHCGTCRSPLGCLNGAISEPGWRSKPSWYLVATEDKRIPSDAQRAMAKRAGSTLVEAKGSHAIYFSQPNAVAALIEQAVSKDNGSSVASRE
jgi:pimeloyl-ACP methyl ester carboxylesterase